jgi:hypothetical protein
MTRRIENWPPGLGRPALWVRFRLMEHWSVWHRSGDTPVQRLTSRIRLTQCGIPLGPTRIAIEERAWPGIPDELCCEVCLRHYLVAKVPPLGSPSGGSTGPRGSRVIRVSQRRGRSNQPTT